MVAMLKEWHSLTIEVASGDNDGSNRRYLVRYLQKSAQSEDLVILLHGMGLDALDYESYLTTGHVNAVAVTLPGFDPDGVGDPLPPVPIEVHTRLLSRFIAEIEQQFANKRLTLVGFSLGADMVLRLAEHWLQSSPPRSRLHGALLLDPNINHSTMTLSRCLAKADPDNPVPEMRLIPQLATDLTELGNISEYLAKITKKDFRQIKRHAEDFISYWAPAGDYGLIRRRLESLSKVARQVRVVFSAAYEDHYDAVQIPFQAPAYHGVTFELTDLDHFALIEPSLLSRQLDKLG